MIRIQSSRARVISRDLRRVNTNIKDISIRLILMLILVLACTFAYIRPVLLDISAVMLPFMLILMLMSPLKTRI